MSDNGLFDDGSVMPYVELPVAANRLKWVRGNPQLRAVAKDDPAQYLGGWRGKVSLSATHDREEIILPPLPLPVVMRTSADGSSEYQVYAAPWIAFLPMVNRTRWEKKTKTRDANGKEVEKLEYWQAQQIKGLAPHREVFGLILADGQQLPGILTLENWSAFISFQRAGEAWKKIQPLNSKLLVKRYGTMGKKQKTEKGFMTVPVMESYNNGLSTPIEAIGLDKPEYVDLTAELTQLAQAARAWATCSRWLNGMNTTADAPVAMAAAVAEDEMLDPDLAQPVDDIPF